MNSEIKRLLKLSNIPNFKLSEVEEQMLNDWKAKQEPVEIKPKRTRRKKTTNEVKEVEKETGTFEIVEPTVEES